MELSEFIHASLVQIAKGIEDANNDLDQSSAIVNPREISNIEKDQRMGFYETEEGKFVPVNKITFDVAVTASEGTQTKGGLGVVIGAVTLGSQGQSDNKNSSASRLSFSIPMVLPSPEVK